MHFFTVCIFTFVLAVCYVQANDHSHHSSVPPPPEEADRKKREEGPPHPISRERRQIPPNEPHTMHTPTPSRRKRHSETTTTVQVNPIMEQADDMADAIDESESAGVKKREVEGSTVAIVINDGEEEEEIVASTESAIEKREGDDEEGDSKISASEDVVQGHISRAKRVSHAGSSHKNRPSAVNRLQSNSNVGGEEEGEKDPEHENDVHHHDYEFDHIHTY